MSKEAMKLALEALEKADSRDGYLTYITEIEALREALAEQPAPMIRGDIRDGLVDDEPAQSSKPWVGLTDEDIKEAEWLLSAIKEHEAYTLQEQLLVEGVDVFARAIEAKLREKNA